MQLRITIKNFNEITLPISYHHIQQSAIYALIKGTLHDEGMLYDKRDYKMFTFSEFTGKYLIKNKRITFYDKISFEFRCFDNEIGETFINNIKEYGFRLGDISYHNIELDRSDLSVSTNQIRIKMLAPICVYETGADKHTRYFNPGDDRFAELVNENFVRKYTAAYGQTPHSGICLKLERCTDKDKCLTKYKNYYIEAWRGVYSLNGNPDYLTFLYNVGLGAKNSQGFGMFGVISS